MSAHAKTKQQLIAEVQQLRREVTHLRAAEHQGAIHGLDAAAESGGPVDKHTIIQQYDAFFAQAIRSARANIFCLDMNTGEFIASPSTIALHGFPPDTAVDQDTAMATIYPEDRSRVDAAWRGCIERGEPYLMEYRVFHQDGSTHWIAAQAEVVPGPHGPRLLGMCQDITERKRAEEERRQLSDIIERSLNEIYVFDPETLKFKHANLGALKNLGYTLKEIRNLTPVDVKPDFTETSFRTMIQPLLANEQETLIFQTVHRRADGSLYPVEVHLQVIDAHAQPVCLAIIFDITERKQAEESLRKAKDELEERVRERTRELVHINQRLLAQGELLHKIVENIPVMIAYFDATGKATFFNHQLLQMIGISADEAEDTDIMARMYPDSGYRREVLAYMLETSPGWKDILMRVAGDRQLETSWTSVHLSDGSHIGIGIDISERKRAEEALEESERQFKSLFMESPVSILIHDRDSGEIIDANPKAFASYNIGSLEELKASTFWMEPPYSFADALGWIRKTALEGPQQFEWLNRKVTGELFWEQVHLNRVVINGVERVLATTIDITERKRMEEELRVSEVRFRQLSSELLQAQENERKRIATEIHDSAGQVLAAIKYRVEAALQQLKGAGHGDVIEPVEKLVPLIKRCIDDMRRLQMELRPSILDEMGIVAAIQWLCREFQLTSPSVAIEQDLVVAEDEIPDTLKIVLFRIVQEALNNAGKHSKAQRVRISLQRNHGVMELRIQDDGLGFNLEEVQQVKAFGKGLGLSSMQERAQFSGGTLTIESAPGSGTCIDVRWPKKELA